MINELLLVCFSCSFPVLFKKAISMQKRDLNVTKIKRKLIVSAQLIKIWVRKTLEQFYCYYNKMKQKLASQKQNS